MFRSLFVQPVKKRPRLEEASAPRCEEVKFKDVRLYLVERKMGSSRRRFLSQLARSKGFIVDGILSDAVTHIVSEDTQSSSLWTWLKTCHLKTLTSVQVLNMSWFTESMREGRPVAVETRHQIQDIKPADGCKPRTVATVSQYACQRRTTTQNHNTIFTDAMEVLAENYEFNMIEGSCLAFRKAASVLKSLPYMVRRLEDIQDLPCFGQHTKSVAEEIIKYGHSFQAGWLHSDERYQTLKLFTSVFGVGPKTAEKWYRSGLRSLNDILTEPSIQLNRMQQTGFLHYEDISRAVSKAEAQALENIIDKAVHEITTDAILTLTGGFRRGKEFGHDVDFIVTSPELGRERSLLPDIIEQLEQEGILLFCDNHPSTLDESKLPCYRFEAMDNYAKCFLVLKLRESEVKGGFNETKKDGRGWRAVRVDLVSPPMDRYAYALLGWTGSRQFERDLRRFARMERHMILDNHTLYDKTKEEFLAATTEKDIFAHLGLEYMEPWQRNA